TLIVGKEPDQLLDRQPNTKWPTNILRPDSYMPDMRSSKKGRRKSGFHKEIMSLGWLMDERIATIELPPVAQDESPGAAARLPENDVIGRKLQAIDAWLGEGEVGPIARHDAVVEKLLPSIHLLRVLERSNPTGGVRSHRRARSSPPDLEPEVRANIHPSRIPNPLRYPHREERGDTLHSLPAGP